MELMNPFVVGREIPDEFFCDRVVETETLVKQVRNGRNVALISQRRLGKTGLIHHLFQQQFIRDNYYTFFIDIYSTLSFDEFVYTFGQEVYKQLKDKSLARRFFEVITSLRLAFKVDGTTGEPYLKLSLGDLRSAKTTLDEIFTYLETADKPCLVAIDEFQQIGNYAEKNVEAILRTKIQHCSNTQFIFSGSKKHMMANMFNSPSRPFYQSSLTIGIAPLPNDIYAEFSSRLFALYSKNIATRVVNEVYTKYNGVTWFMQMMLNELFDLTPVGATCSMEMLSIAEDNIINLQQTAHESTLAMLSSKQKSLLIAIMREGVARNVTAGSFVNRHNLSSPSSVQSALKGLVDKDIVVVDDDQSCRIENFFFAQWLKRKF